MHHAHLGQHRAGGIVYDLAIFHYAVVPIARVGVQGHVGHHTHVGHGGLHGLHGTGQQAVGVQGFGACVVLQGIGHLGKEEYGANAQVPQAAHLVAQQV